jgi:hypothetical protein
MRRTVPGKMFAVVAVAAVCACGGLSEGSDGGASGGSSGGSSSSSGASSSSGGSSGAGSSSGAATSNADAGRVPLNHRPSDAQCSMPAPPGDCASPGPPPGGCTSDSSCSNAGPNGRCINQGGGPAADCFCTSDACVQDTDCPSGQTCACHGSPYTDGRGNACVQGNCRVDADCGAGAYCSPSPRTAICGDSLAGYYCHTAEDQCIDDTDCPSSPNVAGIPGCVYSTTDSRWECGDLPVCE